MPLIKLNSPIPVPLPKEVQKCAKILLSFVDSTNNGLDGVIPRQVLENAKGFAIFTVFKAGFVVSARAGSGVVIARLDDGSWSAPSAIGIAGMGFGGQAGAEVTDFLVVLNSRSAVRSFMSAGSLTLGGNMSIAVGPLGRNGEASGSLNTHGHLATMYSYSKTKGLFGGVSIEGSVLVERQDANAIAYDADVTAKSLLSGVIPVPSWADVLIRALENCTGLPGGRKWIEEDPEDSPASPAYIFGGIGTPPVDAHHGRKRTLSSPWRKTPSPAVSNGGAQDESYFPSGTTSNSSTPDYTDVPDIRPPISRRRSLLGGRSSPKTSPSAPRPQSTYFSSLGSPLEIDGYSSPSPPNPSSSSTSSKSRFLSSGGPFDPFKGLVTQSRHHPRSGSSLRRSPFGSNRGSPALDEFGEADEVEIGDEEERYMRPGKDFAFPEELVREQRWRNTAGRESWADARDMFDPLRASGAPEQDLFADDPFEAKRKPSTHVPPAKPIAIFHENPKPLPSSFSGGKFSSSRYADADEDDEDVENKSSATVRPGPPRRLNTKSGLKGPDAGLGKGIALFDFTAQQSGDLGFRKGDVIIILKRTESVNDWWTGAIGDRTGMFPANFVEVVP